MLSEIDWFLGTMYGLAYCYYIFSSDLGLLDGVLASQILCSDSMQVDLPFRLPTLIRFILLSTDFSYSICFFRLPI